jgi:S-adenosylmethionine-diacylgycerolhomoserine-N-methlytransferase
MDAGARMDRMYRLQRHVYDATRAYYLLGRDRLLRGLPSESGLRVAEIGCGTARNLIRLARLRPELNLYGLDASAAMLTSARTNIRRAGLSSRIAVCRALAERFDPAKDLCLREPFDAAYFSYVLSMLDDPLPALEAAWKTIKPGGMLAVVDFGDFSGLPGGFRRLLTGWLGLFGVRPKPWLVGHFQAMADLGRAEASVESLYRGYAFLAFLRKRGA